MQSLPLPLPLPLTRASEEPPQCSASVSASRIGGQLSTGPNIGFAEEEAVFEEREEKEEEEEVESSRRDTADTREEAELEECPIITFPLLE